MFTNNSLLIIEKTVFINMFCISGNIGLLLKLISTRSHRTASPQGADDDKEIPAPRKPRIVVLARELAIPHQHSLEVNKALFRDACHGI
jgi:hypothetical protein